MAGTLQRTEQSKWYIAGHETEECSVFTTALSRADRRRAVTPNDLLRAARQRTASLTSPEVCLSRQELAELVNAWAWKHRDKMLEHSANWLGQLERGRIRWPGTVAERPCGPSWVPPPTPRWDSPGTPVAPARQ